MSLVERYLSAMDKSFSDYVVYVDESGDHNLEKPDPAYPIFVLAFCIFEKERYVERVAPPVQQLKFEFFGHDMVILHEREIRKAGGPFRILQVPEVRSAFMEKLNALVENAPFTLIASVIDKKKLTSIYEHPRNPYSLAMAFGLERVTRWLSRRNAQGTTHCVFERRGQREDDELELEFRRVCDGENYLERKLPFDIVFAPKSCNSAGLQIADMVARPIGRHVLDPGQSNRAFEILKSKFRRKGTTGPVEGYGLKIFPE